MPKKDKDAMVKVRVNPAGLLKTDEVFVQSASHDDDPQINYTVYAKPGMFKDGELSADEAAKLAEKSRKALEDEHAKQLEQEAKERAAKAEVKQEG